MCICESVNKAAKTLKSTTQFQKLTDYLQHVVCVVLIYLCNVRRGIQRRPTNKQTNNKNKNIQTPNTTYIKSCLGFINLSQDFYYVILLDFFCSFQFSYSFFFYSVLTLCFLRSQSRMKVKILQPSQENISLKENFQSNHKHFTVFSMGLQLDIRKSSFHERKTFHSLSFYCINKSVVARTYSTHTLANKANIKLFFRGYMIKTATTRIHRNFLSCLSDFRP